MRQLAVGFKPRIGSVAGERPRLGVIGEIKLQRLLDDARAQPRVLDRKRHLDTAEEIALHPVGGREPHLLGIVVPEPEDPGVFEKPADDGTHADIVGYPRHAGPQATDAAHDQVDLYARLRGAVERLDNLAVDQGVQFGDDPGRAPGPGHARFALDPGQ